ncbi:LL-diaminopimelate aminotransferase [Hominifimenecus sp. rT4P-3]|uniref:LL-diaminopimelate aminotransferase n=1 Tax=Hominifimenecus sp. rT4P-3 TaxID=3242979 RepID=UPI003DA3619A
MKINENYRSLETSYLFSQVAAKKAAYQAAHPDQRILSLGIGDVTRPLPTPVVQAFTEAVLDQGDPSRFHGYGPEQGYDFLKESIQQYYRRFGVELPIDDLFISDGAKCDLGNILDLFDTDNTVLIPDPVYPVYRDTNQMAGRRIAYLPAGPENGFLPMPDPDQKADIIYLCSPNNPTGAVYTKAQLAEWVDYANKQGAVILFDAAYEAFVTSPELPHSIYEIEGARECAIEVCSLSKTAGFTGTRCGYTVVPQELIRGGLSLRAMWLRRQTTKFNGVSYPVQRAAAAAFSDEGMAACQEVLSIYRSNARLMHEALEQAGIWHTGGIHSPYLWMKCPHGLSSWEFFDQLLEKAQVIGTPGCGFGTNGEGFFRLTAFGTPEDTAEAMERIRKFL